MNNPIEEEPQNDSPEDGKPDEELPRLRRWKKSYGDWRKFKEVDKKRIFEKEYTSTIVAKFILPFVMALEFALILYILFPNHLGDLGELFVFYFFNPAGMEVGVLYGFKFTDLSYETVVIFMLVIDTLTAMFLIWNFNYSRLLPFFGWLVWVVQASAERKIKKSRSFQRGSFVGLIFFVMIPAYGTGAILGGIVGKLLNMKPWLHFFAIFIGSSLRLTVMAVVIHFLLELMGW
jgi:uncharacterized membrane protein